jgi:endonuclease YncB( thermonuclease family)
MHFPPVKTGRAMAAWVALIASLAVPSLAEGATRYVAPNGSGSACTAVAPCASFDAAYRAAAPGDSVEVAAGSYGTQRIPALGKPGPAIEFRPAAGAGVTLGEFDVLADHVTVRSMSMAAGEVGSVSANDPVEGVTFIDVNAAEHWLSNGRDFTWKGGSIGPRVDKQIAFIGGSPASYRTTYDGVLFHDATRTSSSVHTECLFAMGVQGLTVRNSRFRNCAVFNAYIGKIGSDPDPRDVLFENNVMEKSMDVGGKSGYYAMIFDKAAFKNITLRNNTFAQGVLLGDASTGTSFENARLTGNIMATGNCSASVSYSRNIFTDRKCGASDRAVAGAFGQLANPAGGDYHLKPGAAAIDAADPGEAPPTDADGYARNVGAAPDVGAYEFGAGPASAPPAQQPAGAQPPGRRSFFRKRRGRLLRVVNAETLRVRLSGGRRRTVRLLGVNAPRRNGRTPTARCGAHRAEARLRAIVSKRHRIRLLVPRGRRGGRVVVMAGRVDVGRRLIGSGWARTRPAQLPAGRRAAYSTAQERAQAQPRGLWKICS